MGKSVARLFETCSSRPRQTCTRRSRRPSKRGPARSTRWPSAPVRARASASPPHGTATRCVAPSWPSSPPSSDAPIVGRRYRLPRSRVHVVCADARHQGLVARAAVALALARRRRQRPEGAHLAVLLPAARAVVQLHVPLVPRRGAARGPDPLLWAGGWPRDLRAHRCDGRRQPAGLVALALPKPQPDPVVHAVPVHWRVHEALPRLVLLHISFLHATDANPNGPWRRPS